MSMFKLMANLPTIITPDRHSNHDMRVNGKRVGPSLHAKRTVRTNGKLAISFTVKIGRK